MNNYFQLVRLCESTYKAFLDSLKCALFDLEINNLSPIQALIILNLGENEINIKDFIRCGYYSGTNVTYNLNSLVENGYMLSIKNPGDARSRRISLSEKGIGVFDALSNMINNHNKTVFSNIKDCGSINDNLRSVNKNIELLSVYA